MQSPTVMVKAGFTEDALIMSGLSPVARMESPRRVFRNSASSPAAANTITSATTSLYQPPSTPPRVSFAMEKILSHLKMLKVDEKPITARFTV